MTTIDGKRYLRNAVLNVWTAQSSFGIDGLRIKFEIEKDISRYANTAFISVYNLSQKTRGMISNEFQRVALSAGYGDKADKVFDGKITNIFHRREGADFITEIYAQDGIDSSSRSVVNIADSGVRTLTESVRKIAGYFTDADGLPPTIGEISLENGNTMVGGIHYSGYVSDLLDEFAKSYQFDWFFLDGKFVAVSDGMTLQKSTTSILSSENGLIGVPEVTELGIKARCLMTPSIYPKSQVRIRSASKTVQFGNRFFDNIPASLGEGTFDVRTITHIGDTRGSDWYSEFEAGRIRGFIPLRSLDYGATA